MGKPIAGAEVRIWQKLEENLWGVPDQPVKFDGGEALITDAEGRFSTPDSLVGESFAWIVVEAHDMLAGRSGWIEIGKGDTAAPDIVMTRLRAVIGQVHDSQGQPVAGATVFNAGDGHERVETKTGRTGKFFLEGVPEGAVFLFAEKSGYRFTGMHLPAGGRDAALTLTSLGEIVEPLTTLPPLRSADEEKALAREALDPWLDKVTKSGTEMQKLFAIASLSHLDPLGALRQFDTLPVQSQKSRATSRHGLVALSVGPSGALSSDEIGELIESGDDHFFMAYEWLEAARHLDDRERRLERLDSALRHARRIEDTARRTQALASIAEALFSIGQRERAGTIFAEAEELAESLPEQPNPIKALNSLVLASLNSDADRAIEWLSKIKMESYHQRCCGQAAIRLLPDRPELAEEVWNRAGARRPHRPSNRSAHLADFCYRLTGFDRSRAERVAKAAVNSAMRIRGKGAIALALAEAQPAEARKLLKSLVRKGLADAASDADPRMRSWSPPTTVAWLLPIAERVAPELCREIFWRSLALRLPRPRRSPLSDAVQTTDVELAKMLARYDRNIARALLEQPAARLAQKRSVAATGLISPEAFFAAMGDAQPSRDLIAAATHIDPRWARELLDAVPVGSAASQVCAPEGAWQAFVIVLTLHGRDRWQEGNSLCAGFWTPSLDKP